MARQREGKKWTNLKKENREGSSYHETRQIRTKKGIKDTSKRMELNIIYDRVINDIEQNNEVFYGNHSLYLHNHLNWFEKSAGIVNQKLVDIFSKAKTEFKKDSDSLKKIVLSNQEKFFSEMSKIIPEASTQEGFVDWYKSVINLTTIDNYIERMDNIKFGYKSKEELNNLLNLIRDVYQDILSTTIDKNFPQDLNEKIKKMNSALSNAKFNGQEGIVKVSGLTGIGLSKTSLQNYYLPLLIERTIGSQVKEAIPDIMFQDKVKLVSQQTAKGSSADLEIASGHFSIKTRKAKQEKSRIIQNFNNWNDSLSNPVSVSVSEEQNKANIDNLHKFLAEKDFFSMSEYICYNYAYLGATDRELLDDSFRLLALSSLHEKMFGYNKGAQAGITLEDLINSFPIATLNAKGEVIFMDKMLDSVIDKINSDIAQLSTMDSYFTYKLEAAFSSKPRFNKNITVLDSLWRSKLYAIEDIRKDKRTTTYAELKQLVKKEIDNKIKSMQNNIRVSIAYNFQPTERSETK